MEEEEEEKEEKVEEEEKKENNNKNKNNETKKRKNRKGDKESKIGSCLWLNESCSSLATSVRIMSFVLFTLSWIMWNYIGNYES